MPHTIRPLLPKKPVLTADVHAPCEAALKEMWGQKLALEARVKHLELLLREVRSRAIGFSEYIHGRLDDK